MNWRGLICLFLGHIPTSSYWYFEKAKKEMSICTLCKRCGKEYKSK